MPPIASLILVASAGQTSIQRVLSRLRAQTIAPQLELVLAAQPFAMDDLRNLEPDGLHSVQVVEADFSTSARARVPAIHAAQADIVIMCEDHCFPESEVWAERLVAGFAKGHAAVGPRILNDNPGSGCSWANLLIEYGPWVSVESPGEVDLLPGHNSAYRKKVLLDYGDDLADMLEVEWAIHRDLRAQGETLWVDPGAATRHLNFSRWDKCLYLHLLEGWMFAASRARTWSFGLRLVWALAFPAIFLVRAWRLAGQARAAGVLWSLPIQWLFLMVSAVGEGLGYAFGDCGKRGALGALEYDRWRNVRPTEADRAFTPVPTG